jgi:hypothetical protein
MNTFNKFDKVVRKGTFDGFIGTITQLNYLGESNLVLVRFPGGECFENVSDLVLHA